MKVTYFVLGVCCTCIFILSSSSSECEVTIPRVIQVRARYCIAEDFILCNMHVPCAMENIPVEIWIASVLSVTKTILQQYGAIQEYNLCVHVFVCVYYMLGSFGDLFSDLFSDLYFLIFCCVGT